LHYFYVDTLQRGKKYAILLDKWNYFFKLVS
jgi:hypothetical protein